MVLLQGQIVSQIIIQNQTESMPSSGTWYTMVIPITDVFMRDISSLMTILPEGPHQACDCIDDLRLPVSFNPGKADYFTPSHLETDIINHVFLRVG